jgi:DNA processing protein
MDLAENKLRDYLALWSIRGIGSMTSRKLIAYAGSVSDIFKIDKKTLLKISGISNNLVEKIISGKHYEQADKELEFIEKYKIKVTSIFDKDYPYRLKQCEDAPLLLFTKGKQLDDNKKYIAIVGTRDSTWYGEKFCEDFISSLKEKEYDVVIISGLAYGIDITAHKLALKYNIPTYGVLAHGLSTMYPASHRDIATKMLENGGLITEFMHSMFPDKINFVRRNRIIAGLSDATIIVESDIKGGSLITADLANSYNRDVFAVPGRLNDKYSLGTNKLIKSNRAVLIESISDLEYVMGWDSQVIPKQATLFQDFTEEEQKIVDILNSNKELNIDTICKTTGLKMSKVSAILLNLEFKGAVKCLPGKIFCKV